MLATTRERLVTLPRLELMQICRPRSLLCRTLVEKNSCSFDMFATQLLVPLCQFIHPYQATASWELQGYGYSHTSGVLPRQPSFLQSQIELILFFLPSSFSSRRFFPVTILDWKYIEFAWIWSKYIEQMHCLYSSLNKLRLYIILTPPVFELESLYF